MKGLSERQITVIIKEPCRKAKVEYLFDNSLETFKKQLAAVLKQFR